MTCLIDDLPIEHGGFPHQTIKQPEGSKIILYFWQYSTWDGGWCKLGTSTTTDTIPVRRGLSCEDMEGLRGSLAQRFVNFCGSDLLGTLRSHGWHVSVLRRSTWMSWTRSSTIWNAPGTQLRSISSHLLEGKQPSFPLPSWGSCSYWCPNFFTHRVCSNSRGRRGTCEAKTHRFESLSPKKDVLCIWRHGLLGLGNKVGQ